jgi:hypothetical protein
MKFLAILALSLLATPAPSSATSQGGCSGCLANNYQDVTLGSAPSCVTGLRWTVTLTSGACTAAGGGCGEQTGCTADMSLAYQACCTTMQYNIQYAVFGPPIVDLGYFGDSCSTWTTVATINNAAYPCGLYDGNGAVAIITELNSTWQITRQWKFDCTDCM